MHSEITPEELSAALDAAAREVLDAASIDRPPVDALQGEISWRRGNLPGRAPPLSSAESACRRAAHEENLTQRMLDRLCAIQAWPVHEEGWKREILRTEVQLEGVD